MAGRLTVFALMAALAFASPSPAIENEPGIANPNTVPGQGPDAHVQGRCMASFIFFMALSRSAIDGGVVPAHQVSYLETIAFAANRYWYRTRDEVDASAVEHHDRAVAVYQEELVRFQSLVAEGGELSIMRQADDVGTCAATLGYLDN